MSGEDGKFSWHDMIEIEKTVRQYCKIKFQKAGINPDHVQVLLSKNMNREMYFIGGSPVKLVLLWPHCLGNINIHLKDFCAAFRKHRLYRPMELMPFAIAKDGRKLVKELFKNEDDIILDLIPKRRIIVSRSETLTFTDSVTKESISVTVKGKESRFDGENVEVWFSLSRRVRDKFPVMEDDAT